MGVLATMCMTAWTVHPADISSRQGVDFTLTFTAVAFKLVLVDMLPKLSYMTFLDYCKSNTDNLPSLSLWKSTLRDRNDTCTLRR